MNERGFEHEKLKLRIRFRRKRGMVRAGGSASRTIGDQGSTDLGGGVGRRPAPWQPPVGRGRGSHWAPDTQAFLPLG